MPEFSTKVAMQQHQPDQGFAETLAGLKKGHDRLEVGGHLHPCACFGLQFVCALLQRRTNEKALVPTQAEERDAVSPAAGLPTLTCQNLTDVATYVRDLCFDCRHPPRPPTSQTCVARLCRFTKKSAVWPQMSPPLLFIREEPRASRSAGAVSLSVAGLA